MILVSEAGSTFWSGLDAASSWPLFTSMTIQALAAMVGAGTADTSPTGTTPVVAGTAAAGAVAAAGACCCARTGAGGEQRGQHGARQGTAGKDNGDWAE